MEKNILISVDFILQAKFFLRFSKAMPKMGFQVKYITYQWSAYQFLKARVDKKDLFFVQRVYHENRQGQQRYLKDAFEAVTGEYKVSELQGFYESVWSTVSSIEASDVAYIFMWNGCRVSDHALTDFARRNNIKTIYFELANIEGKIFIDPQGTNARSYLYNHPEDLSGITVNEEEYENWRKQYIADKFKQNTVKQAKRKTPGYALLTYIQDVSGYYLFHGALKRKFPIGKIRAWLLKPDIRFESFDYKAESYIFFPLQVSNDTQVLINGNMTLMEALQHAINLAKGRGIFLVIKPHPAESNPQYLSDMKTLLNSYDKVVFSNLNTFELITHADTVVTINSTVGLEALIAKKDVEIVGKAVYEKFTQHDVAAYIMKYLVDIDYWGAEDITEAQARTVLKRGEQLSGYT